MQRDPWVVLSHPREPAVFRRQGEQSGPTGPRAEEQAQQPWFPNLWWQTRQPLLCPAPCCLALVGTRYRWDPADQLKAASHGPASPTPWDPEDSPGPLPSGAARGSRASSVHNHPRHHPPETCNFTSFRGKVTKFSTAGLWGWAALGPESLT